MVARRFIGAAAGFIVATAAGFTATVVAGCVATAAAGFMATAIAGLRLGGGVVFTLTDVLLTWNDS